MGEKIKVDSNTDFDFSGLTNEQLDDIRRNFTDKLDSNYVYDNPLEIPLVKITHIINYEKVNTEEWFRIWEIKKIMNLVKELFMKDMNNRVEKDENHPSKIVIEIENFRHYEVPIVLFGEEE